MMVIPGKHRYLIVIPLLFIPLIFTSCSEKITDVHDQKIELKIRTSIDNLADVSQATTFVLTVTGTGIEEPIVEQLIYSDGFLMGTVVVPAGPRRKFRIEAFDESGRLMYAGQTTADVETDSMIELRIVLRPQVPMMKISPMYIERPQGTLLAMKIRVYNVRGLNTIEGFLGNLGEITSWILPPDSVTLNPEIADFTTLTWQDAGEAVYFKVEHNGPGGRFVDDTGFAELLTAYYRTWTFDIYPAETFHFYPSISLLIDMEGNTLPSDDVYTENATAVLYDYRLRRMAYWHMGWGWGSNDWYWIEDRSGNDLHGSATGTTYDYGISDGARSFDGDSDFVEVPDHDLLDIEEAITIAIWFNIYPVGAAPGGLSTRSTLISKRSEDGPINYQLMIEDISPTDGYVSILFIYGSRVYHTYRVDIPDDLIWGWRRAIFSYEFGDPSSALFVLDNYIYLERMEGEWVAGSGLEPAPLSNNPLFIGKDNSANPCYYKGIIDDVELFNAAFNLTEIMYLFQRLL